MTSVNAQHIPAHSAVESSGQGTDSSQPHNASAAEEVNQKRHLRERHFTNYNEDYIQFDSIEFDERPYKRVRPDQVAAVPSIAASHLELETAWAVVVNAGESILDEEEDLLPAGAHEQVYVQVGQQQNQNRCIPSLTKNDCSLCKNTTCASIWLLHLPLDVTFCVPIRFATLW